MGGGCWVAMVGVGWMVVGGGWLWWVVVAGGGVWRWWTVGQGIVMSDGDVTSEVHVHVHVGLMCDTLCDERE